MESTVVGSRTRSGFLSYLSLFTSFGTLLCCALPSLFVLFGLGATVASLLSAAPWLVYLSRHKNWVFVISGLLIGGNFVYLYRIAPQLQLKRGACSPDDPAACETASRFSRVVLWTSGILYLIGCFTAYVLGPLLVRMES
jgi:mercuric ion transport protein